MCNSKLFETKKFVYSFEVFPPKLNYNVESVASVLSEMGSLSPDFISVTYGAGGSVKDNKTLELCKIIMDKTNVAPVAHLTCVGSTKADLREILRGLYENGVRNILALRGDTPQNSTFEGDFRHANELISFIKSEFGDSFDVCGACYPTGHHESENQKADILNLKHKIASGAKFLVSQLFFDNDDFYRFLELADFAGIDAPIQAGIMPITNKRQIERMITLSGATIPAKLSRLIAKYSDDDVAMKDAGIAYATEQIVDLLASGVKGVHLYTMNNVSVAKRITDNIKGMLRFDK